MSEGRLALLKRFLDEDPADPFNHYALALEYASVDPAKATELFVGLLKNHADYLPTYYQAAVHFIHLHQSAQAHDVLRKGIALAHQQGNTKTARELKSVLDELEME
jgi:hypothetical protein